MLILILLSADRLKDNVVNQTLFPIDSNDSAKLGVQLFPTVIVPCQLFV